jgi:membrane protein required for colicin V production
MHESSIYTVDVLVVAIVAISTLFAVYRGFVRETLSVFAWAAAAFAVIYFGPAGAALLRPHFSTPFLGAIIAYAGIFVAVLLPLTILGYRLSRGVRSSPVGAIDRCLGFVFGVIRGLALVSVVYLAFSLVIPVREHPVWLTQARLLPVIKKSSEILLALLPDKYSEAFANSGVAPAPKATPGPSSDVSGMHRDHKTYGAQDRRALDRLIEATGSGANGKP